MTLNLESPQEQERRVQEEATLARYREVSARQIRSFALGDCFCLARAQQLGGEVVTSDRQFDPVNVQGGCPVQFIR